MDVCPVKTKFEIVICNWMVFVYILNLGCNALPYLYRNLLDHRATKALYEFLMFIGLRSNIVIIVSSSLYWIKWQYFVHLCKQKISYSLISELKL